MKVIHLSGLHLGRGEGAGAGAGIGPRGPAGDSVRAHLRAAFAQIAELCPRLVVVAGDVFDHPGVSASAVAAFCETVADLRERLPGVVVAVAAGARDTPPDPERPSPLALAGALAFVEVACASVRRVRVADGALSATLAPHGALAVPDALTVAPDPRAKWNVLVVHAALAAPESSAPVLDATGWDYVAMGSAPARKRVSDRVHYAGPLSASNGGFLLARLDTGHVRFCPVNARPAAGPAPAATPADGAESGADGKSPGKSPVRPPPESTPLPLPASLPSPAPTTPSPYAALLLNRLGRALGAAGSELADARGLAAFVGDGDALLDAARSALAHARDADRPTPQDLRSDHALRSDHPLRSDELAALWCGAGSVDQWQAAGAKLIQPPRASADPGEQLRTLLEEAAEAKGDLEAGTVAWVRERQDAETRLLLYRDRGRELKARLAEIDAGGPDAPCGACGRPLGSRFDKVLAARREEWEDMVRDGRWWRRRRDQLELKPASLRTAEARSLKLAATVADLSQAAAPDTGAGQPNEPRPRADAPARERFRALVQARTLSLAGGRVDDAFPALYAEWEEGRRRAGSDMAALELAARIVMAELAADVGLDLGSMVVPAGLDRLLPDDLSRALVALARLARRVPLVLVGTTEDVAYAAPEHFDLLFQAEDASGGPEDATDGPRLRRHRLGPRAVRLRGG